MIDKPQQVFDWRPKFQSSIFWFRDYSNASKSKVPASMTILPVSLSSRHTMPECE